MDIWFYLQCLLIPLITLSIIWVWRKWTYWDRLGVPNTGPFAQFLAHRNRTAGDVEIEWYQKYGGVYGVYKYFTPTLTVGTLEHSKNILIRDFAYFRNHTPLHVIDPRFDQNFYSVHYEDWKRMRGIAEPIFSSFKVNGMFESIQDSIHTFITNISKLEVGSSISIKKYLDHLTTDVMLSYAFGVKSDSLNDSYDQIILKSEEFFKVFFDSDGFFGSKFVNLSSLDYISKLTLDFVAQRREENLKTGMKRSDFLQALVDAKYKEGGALLSDNQICGFGIAFLTEGIGATPNMMTVLFYHLATNQNIQSKLFQEISSLSELNADSVSSLTYLDAVLKETSRLWTTSLRSNRVCEKDCKLEGTNITIPAGMEVEIPVHAMQRDPKYFPDPLEFKPERYLAGGENERLSLVSILTFGAGPRGCLAVGFTSLLMKLVMVTILRKFKIGTTSLTKLVNTEKDVFEFPDEVFVTLEKR